MIVEWVFSLFFVWFFPSFFSLFNPFYLPISSYILKRKPFLAALSAYSVGLLRDIFLATPRFGMMGLSSLCSTLVAFGICSHFSLEGLWGSCILTALLAFCDILFSTCLGSLFCEHAFFSWKTLIYTLLLSSLWTFIIKSAPMLVKSLYLRRRHCDSDS